MVLVRHYSSTWMMGLAVVTAVAAAACSSDGPKSDGGTGGTSGSTDGGTGGTHSDATSGDTAGGTMTLTSSVLTEGGNFPAANTCAGANTSPPLSWNGAPAGTMSYAVTLTDLTISAVHWVIWDIPAATTSLPAALAGDTALTTPVTAKQIHKTEFFGAGGAYRGPCPPTGVHTYQFEVSAIPTATLAGVSGTSTVEDVRAAVVAAARAHGDLTAMSDARMPDAGAGGQ